MSELQRNTGPECQWAISQFPFPIWEMEIGKWPIGILALYFLLLCTACKPMTSVSPPAPHAVARTLRSMGSELQLTAWTADEASASAAFEAVFAEMQRLDDLMTTWREGSDIDRLNAAAG